MWKAPFRSGMTTVSYWPRVHRNLRCWLLFFTRGMNSGSRVWARSFLQPMNGWWRWVLTWTCYWRCHSGIFFKIFFTFFGHFLHSLFPLFMHFPLCFPFLLLCLSQHIWPISLSNLILVILSLQTDFTFFLFSFPLFSDHTLGDKTNEVFIIGAHRPGRQEATNKNLSTRRFTLMSPQKPFDLIGFLILIGIGLGPLLLAGPTNSESLPSLLFITERLS